jgi:hypothetical protein
MAVPRQNPQKELLKPTLQQQVPVAMPSRETTRM